jgi:hypothetical protein
VVVVVVAVIILHLVEQAVLVVEAHPPQALKEQVVQVRLIQEAVVVVDLLLAPTKLVVLVVQVL